MPPPQPAALDRDLPTLHIRCGSDIRDKLREAGCQGDFLEFADPFCIGPVPALPEPEFRTVRARFLVDAFGLSAADMLARQRREYGALAALEPYRRLVLWFEHDSYDQLILAYLLHRLAGLAPAARVELIAVDAVPGITRFIGLGQLAPAQLAALWRQRTPVTDAQVALGAEAWAAITAPTPERLDALARTGTPALPMLGRALRRHLRELPAHDTGLGLSERLTLEILREHGPLPVERVFAMLTQEREPLPYLGDLMFWWLIQPLLGTDAPLLEVAADPDAPWPRRRLRITDAGAAVLAARRDWLAASPPPRWVGGVRVPGDAGCWRYDTRADRPVWRPA